MKSKYKPYSGGRVGLDALSSPYRDHQVTSKRNLTWKCNGLDTSREKHAELLDHQSVL